jgi:hypothetical protein
MSKRKPGSGRFWLAVVGAAVVVCAATAAGAWTQGVHGWFLLMWAGLAGAAAFGAGLVAQLATDWRDQRQHQLEMAQDLASKIEAELRAMMRPLPTFGKTERINRPLDGESRAALLRAERQIVSFVGRAAELRELSLWSEASAASAVRLITGPGGVGKTRLAVEFAVRLEAAGWRCGLLEAGYGGRVIQAIAAVTEPQPTLLVVDYAESRLDLVDLLSELAAHQGEPVIRVLLLARTLGEWWRPEAPLRQDSGIRDILASAEAVGLGPLSASPHYHHEAFNLAVSAFANYYDIPAPPTTLRPVVEEPPVLLLHAAALVAVLTARDGAPAASVTATEDVVTELLGHEGKYWASMATAHGMDRLGVGSPVRRQAVALSGLLGADDLADAREILRRLPVLVEASALTVEAVLGWLRELYPATSSSFLGPIQPDLLLEYMVTSVLSSSDELAASALMDLPENRATHALRVLVRALDHYPASAADLLQRLLRAHAEILALPAVRIARNLDSPVLGNVLADVIAQAPISPEALTALAGDLRQTSLPLVPVTVAVLLRMGINDIGTDQVSSAIQTAENLESIASQLTQMGNHRMGADARRALVRLYRAVEDAEPGRHRADLANALTDLGISLWRLGEDRDALPVESEAAELYRAAEKAEPGRHRRRLSDALTNLGDTLYSLRRYEDAYTVQLEAVALLRADEEAEPGQHGTRLAHGLTNLFGTLRRMGLDEAALPIITETVELYRTAEKADPSHYRAALARSLFNVANTLAYLDRISDSVPFYIEAVVLYRAVEHAEPGSYRLVLAEVLTSLSAKLVHLSRYEEAMAADAETVMIYRVAEQAEPGRHRADLADALCHLGAILDRLDMVEEALAANAEAVELYRAIYKTEAHPPHTHLALALNNLGAVLRRLSQNNNAYLALTEAAGLYRAAEQANPGQPPSGLGLTLKNLRRVLGELDRVQEALAVAVEAVELYRAAEQAESGHYRVDLAYALAELGAILSNLHQYDDARLTFTEAAELYRAAEQAEPGCHISDVADILARLGATLTGLGRHIEALTVTHEAVGIYRALTETDSAAYRGHLAQTLAMLSGILLDLGRPDDAQNARQEADLHGHAG